MSTTPVGFNPGNDSSPQPYSAAKSHDDVHALVADAFAEVRAKWDPTWPTAGEILSEVYEDADTGDILRLWLMMDETPTFTKDNLRVLRAIDETICDALAARDVGRGLGIDMYPIIRHLLKHGYYVEHPPAPRCEPCGVTLSSATAGAYVDCDECGAAYLSRWPEPEYEPTPEEWAARERCESIASLTGWAMPDADVERAVALAARLPSELRATYDDDGGCWIVREPFDGEWLPVLAESHDEAPAALFAMAPQLAGEVQRLRALVRLLAPGSES